MSPIQVLTNNGVDLWDAAEYMLLAEECKAGKQDANWEARWKTLSKRTTGYVNIIYSYKLEDKLTSDMILEVLK